MKRSVARDQCDICDGLLNPERLRVYRRRRGQHFLFEHVAALVCRICGCRIFEPEAVEMMEHELNRSGGRRRKAQLLIVPASR